MEKVLIVTTTDVETEAVLQIFSDFTHRGRYPRMTKEKYRCFGLVGNVKVYMVRSQMGSGGPGASLQTISEAIKALKPDAVIMVGIAFGMHPNEQKMGDILVSTKIATYEAQRIEDDDVFYRGDRVSSSIGLIKKLEEAHLNWKGVDVHFGPMLSGEKLIKSKDFRDKLLRYEPEAAGGEMEGSGLYAAASAAKVDWIIVKAVSDFADSEKSYDYQKQAAQNAALFTLHTILTGFSYNTRKWLYWAAAAVIIIFIPKFFSGENNIKAILLAIWTIMSCGLGFLVYHILKRMNGRKLISSLFLSAIPGIIIFCIWSLYIYGIAPSPANIVISKPQSGYILHDTELYVEGIVSPAESTVVVMVRSESDNKWWIQSAIQPQEKINGIGKWTMKAYIGTKKEGINQTYNIIALASNDSPFFNFITGRALISTTYGSLPTWNKSEPIVVLRKE